MQPRLLLLDNFETPWDIESRQSEITDVLCALSAFPHLAILLTMRGTLPGVGRVKWSTPALPPLAGLPVKASRDLYVDIDPKADSDVALEELLSELDQMPLAVTLMAKVGSEGDTPTQLLKKWGSRGTDAIDETGGDRRTSVSLSIELSLRSNLMKKNPAALQLLSVLALLPAGVRNDALETLVPAIIDPTKARAILLRTSLVYSRIETDSLNVLSPIRSYIAHHHPVTPELWQGAYGFCFVYVQQHSRDDEALAAEEVNLETVLAHALQHDPSETSLDAAVPGADACPFGFTSRRVSGGSCETSWNCKSTRGLSQSPR